MGSTGVKTRTICRALPGFPTAAEASFLSDALFTRMAVLFHRLTSDIACTVSTYIQSTSYCHIHAGGPSLCPGQMTDSHPWTPWHSLRPSSSASSLVVAPVKLPFEILSHYGHVCDSGTALASGHWMRWLSYHHSIEMLTNVCTSYTLEWKAWGNMRV